jgi:hypothetical protein
MKTHCTSLKCRKCDKQFSRDYTRKQHEKQCTEKLKEPKSKRLTCKYCRVPFDTYDTLFQHVIENHPLKKEDKAGIIQKDGDVKSTPQNSIRKRSEQDGNVESTQQIPAKNGGKKERFVRKGALNDAVQQTDIIPEADEKYDLLNFFAKSKSDVENELKTGRERVRDLKWYLNARAEMVRNIDNGQQEKTTAHFRSKTYVSLENDDNDHNLNEAYQKMNASLEEFIHKGSNWVLNKIINMEINTVKYSPVAGSSYMDLPPKLRFSRGLLNIQNEDNECFLWSILAALHPVQMHPERVSNYIQYEDTLNFLGIDFPVSLSKVEKFEKQNNLSINVFGYEDEQVFPLYLTKMGNNCT